MDYISPPDLTGKPQEQLKRDRVVEQPAAIPHDYAVVEMRVTVAVCIEVRGAVRIGRQHANIAASTRGGPCEVVNRLCRAAVDERRIKPRHHMQDAHLLSHIHEFVPLLAEMTSAAQPISILLPITLCIQ